MTKVKENFKMGIIKLKNANEEQTKNIAIDEQSA